MFGSPFGPHSVEGMRVLVVEDEARMASLRNEVSEEGHAVDTAGDGNEGLWMAKENPYNAIVLDVMLPGINGFEVCRQLPRRRCLGAGHHADGQGRSRRPGARARCRS